jgi:hypothetical protein
VDHENLKDILTEFELVNHCWMELNEVYELEVRYHLSEEISLHGIKLSLW